MTRSLLDGRTLKTIAIVGNGPVSAVDAPEIDKADMVLRFNSAPSLGAAGQRVDVLMLNRARVYMSKRINPLALHRAPEVWVNDIEENGQVRLAVHTRMQADLSGFRPQGKGACTAAEIRPLRHQPANIRRLHHRRVSGSRSGGEIHLFGFTHQGKQHTHDWSAEKEWVQQLVEEGRIIRHLTPGPKPTRSFAGKIEYGFRWLEKRAKHYLHNKLLHSGASTKQRIFGQDA